VRGRRRRPVRRLRHAAACLLAAGCLAPPAPRDRYYRLEVAPPARLPVPAFAGVLEVERFSADSAGRGTALAWVADASDREVERRDFDHWVDSPPLLIQREFARALREAGLASEVVTPELGVERDHRLGGRLVRFEEVRGPGAPRVVVEVEIAITDPRRSALELRATYREEREIAGPSVEDVVRAYDAALSALVARLAADSAALARR
jgi:ABC-type uncharacterized transport system auxiliary subunit